MSAPRWLAALFALPLLGCSEASPPAAESRVASSPPIASTAIAVDRGPKIVFLGDSLAAGLHVDAEQAFPAVLQRTLAERGHPFRLVNAGVSGDTTAGGLRRLDWLLAQEPDWVVVELGANDGLRGVALEAIEANLRAILERVRAAGAGAVLLGMRLPPNYGDAYAEGFHALYGRLAEELECEHVPFLLEGVGGVPELNFPDGLHPTAEGHERIAEHLEPLFLRLVPED